MQVWASASASVRAVPRSAQRQAVPVMQMHLDRLSVKSVVRCAGRCCVFVQRAPADELQAAPPRFCAADAAAQVSAAAELAWAAADE